MSLGRDANKIAALIDELADTLSEDQRTSVLRRLETMTISDWEDWRDAHAPDVRAVLAAPPARRSERLGHADQPELLTIAAIQALGEAVALLRAADTLHDHSGGNRRGMAALAATEFRDLYQSDPGYHPEVLGRGWWGHLWFQAVQALAADPDEATDQSG